MKRYTLVSEGAELLECPFGEWVRWQDADAKIEELAERLKDTESMEKVWRQTALENGASYRAEIERLLAIVRSLRVAQDEFQEECNAAEDRSPEHAIAAGWKMLAAIDDAIVAAEAAKGGDL